MNKHKLYKNIIVFAAVSAGFLILCGILVYVIDPFFHYHRPLEGFPYVVDNQLTQNPGMAEHMDYDSVILGSSMTFNFNTGWFEETMGLQTIKLSYSGSYPKDLSNIMQFVFDGKHEVRRAFVAIDPATYSAGKDTIKFPIPEYLYDQNPLNDVNYLLNREVILDYCIRPIFNPDPTDLSTVYETWWTPEYYNESWVLQWYERPAACEKRIEPEEFLQRARINMEENVLPYIRNNPDTTFTVFFPPYSVLYWDMADRENHLDATLEMFRYLMEELTACENVEVFFFTDEEEIVTDLNNYADYIHYSPEISRYMTECFADGKEKITAGDIDGRIRHLRQIYENFDFEGLFAQYPYFPNLFDE